MVEIFVEGVFEEVCPPGAMDLELDSIYCTGINASQVRHRYHFSGLSSILVVCSRQRFAAESGRSKKSFDFRSYYIFFCGAVYRGPVFVVLVTGDDAVCSR
jgi:hypothetical protein